MSEPLAKTQAFQKFLKSHEQKKDGNDKKTGISTHTRMPDRMSGIYPGSFTIADDELTQFYDGYKHTVFVNKIKEYLTEAQLKENGQMAVDLDFRYARDIEQRQHTAEHVINIVLAYLDEFKKIYAFDGDSKFDIFVMEKPNVNRCENLTKDGIHIIFGLKVDYETQQYIRKQLIPILSEEIDLPLVNSWESILDEGISKGTTNWTLYGSRKPAHEAYELVQFWRVAFDPKDSEFKFNENEFDGKHFCVMNNFELLSVRNTTRPKFDKKTSFHNEVREKHGIGKKKVDYKKSVNKSESSTEENTDILSKATDLVMTHIGSRFNEDGFTKKVEYLEKLKIASAMKTIGCESYAFGKWCELGAKREIKNPMTTWNACKVFENTDAAFGCLEKILKSLDSGEKYDNYKNCSSKIGKAMSFKEKCKEFELTHTKITNVSMFVETHPKGDVIFTKVGLVTAYEHETYESVTMSKKNIPVTIVKNFIADWMRNNPTQKIKRKMESYPSDLVCPEDVYNLWRPFSYECEIENYEFDQSAVDIVKKHILILSGRNDVATEFTLDWFASCIQNPSVKLPMPVFVSGEGAGKGSIVRLLCALLGAAKILETQEPSKEVWGEFNALMTNAYIVVLDEISKKEMSGCEGRVKGLITEPTIRINDKGKSRFEMTSYHKFIAIANPDQYGNEPMTTTADDRRKYFMKCSDELIGNTEYFDKFYEMLENKNKMKSIYEYFRTRKITLLKGKLPCTEYNQELKELGTPVLKLFIKDVVDIFDGDEVTSHQLFEMFLKWTEKNRMKYECSSLQFACRFTNLKLKGMTKTNNIGESHVKGWKIDLPVLKKELGMGCLL
jgi:hypothetical protein